MKMKKTNVTYERNRINRGHKQDSIYNNKGLTLIEVIITLAILSIVILAIFSLFDFGIKMFTKSGDQFDVQNNVRVSFIGSVDEFRYASELETLSISEMNAQLAVAGNEYDYIYLEGSSLLLSAYDSGTRVAKTLASNIDVANSFFEPVSSDVLNVKLMSSSSKDAFSVEKEIKLVNLGIEGKGKTILGGKNTAIKFTQNSFDDLAANPPAELSVSLNRYNISLLPSASANLTANVHNFLAADTVTWSSSDVAIATVDSSGVVTSLGPLGEVVIKATSDEDGTKYASCSVTVENVAADPLSITNAGDFNVTKGVAFSKVFIGTGGTLDYTYDMVVHSYDGFTCSLNALTGELSGTAPNGNGKKLEITLTIKDADNDEVSYDITITAN